MDLQDVIEGQLAQDREEAMKQSTQLTLGELILKLEAVDQGKEVVFDDGEFRPTSVGSWRGSYKELAMRYDEGGERLSVSELLLTLREADGEEFTGYKGGQYLMGRTTPVWVANRGDSFGFNELENEDGYREFQAVLDVEETDRDVRIVTGPAPHYL